MKAMVMRLVAAGMAAAVLAGCNTLPTRPLPATDVAFTAEPADEAVRRAELELLPFWSLQGRVAVSKGRNGGSGRIDWLQQGLVYQVSLAAPVTRQSWQLSGGGGQGVRLDGLPGGPRSGPEAGALLLQATGWEIPVEQLAAWVRGMPAPAAAQARAGYDNQGRPRVLQQGQWRIDYLDWYPREGGRPPLPRRIEAVNGDARVRLIVDAWTMGEP